MYEEAVAIPAGEVTLHGDLLLPTGTADVVVFAHGSGSSRHSPRNRAVAAALQREGLGTLLMDLLTEDEESRDVNTAEYRFDIELLGARVVAAVDWLAGHEPARGLAPHLFGASTGAAAALVAAAARPEPVRSVVSRGGRADLAGDALDGVRAPVLLVVGGQDTTVLDLNEQAVRRLPEASRVHVVPWATHLFEEPGALEEVAQRAVAWFREPGRAPGT
ncbi:dienelactone hydrolase family protein [Streptomyces sp. NPDC059740]|uniref:dienelactone hydrolase family protein n=1 Tax=Streptomyces sp. NPDC059740 TaxID=3346926 RepID=UPI003664E48A